MKKLSLLIACLLLAANSLTFAANGTLPGIGKSFDPYLIEDKADFDTFLKNKEYHKEGVYTLLTVDINNIDRHIYNTDKFIVNSYDNTYRGIFDGGNHKITNFELIKEEFFNTDPTGLFPVIATTGVVKNLILEDLYVKSNTYDVGGLCGRNWGIIENCHVSGYVYSSGPVSVGLLVANNAFDISSTVESDGGVIRNCSVSGVVETGSTYIDFTGGLCGSNDSLIENCYADADVHGDRYVGGLCGWNNTFLTPPTLGKVINCYSTGHVSGRKYVGGLTGYNHWSIENCYSTAKVESTESVPGGFSEFISPASSISNSFWDTEIANTSLFKHICVYLPLDETEGATAENLGSFSNYFANVNGNAQWSSGGKINGCSNFDGIDDLIDISYCLNSSCYDSMRISYTDARTFSVWMKTTAANKQVLTGWGENTIGKLWQIYLNEYGNLCLNVSAGEKISSVSVNDGLWHHLAVVLPALDTPAITDALLYIDGELDNNAIASSLQEISTEYHGKVTIGAEYIDDVPINFFTGSMDDYRIFDFALSGNEIAQLAASEEPEFAYLLKGLTTAEMQDITTYQNADWDIVPADEDNSDSVWIIAENEYPKFSWSQSRKDTIFFDSNKILGVSEAEAISLLAASGITANVEYDCSRKVASGNVIACKSKRILRNAQELTIVVSTGIYDWNTNPGDGTEAKPYLISTPGMLFGLLQKKHYRLINDIDLQYYQFNDGCVVRSDFTDDNEFVGRFDGNGHIIMNANISGNCFYDVKVKYGGVSTYGDLSVAGFFSAMYGLDTEVLNLSLDNIHITTEDVYVIGGFVGANNIYSKISNCSVSGTIDVRSFNSDILVGGFAGYGSDIDSCYCKCSIINKSIVNNYGCTAGFVSYGKEITNCYALGEVVVRDYGYGTCFIGYVPSDSIVSNCYSSVNVSKLDNESTIGKFVANGTVSNCFWDAEATRLGDVGYQNSGALGLSTSQMQDVNTFINAGWDFSADDGIASVWKLPYDDYPRLAWEDIMLNSDINNDSTTDLFDFAALASQWLEGNCVDPTWCANKDLNKSGIVDTMDLYIFAEDWLEGIEPEPAVYSELDVYLKLDNTSSDSVIDSSVYKHDGIIYGDPARDSGLKDGCYIFDGTDDYLQIDTYSGIGYSQPRTFASLIKLNADLSDTDKSILTIASWGKGEVSKKWAVIIDDATGQLALDIWGARLKGGPDLEDGQWHHVAVVLPEGATNINQVKLYVDGAEVSTNAGSLNAVIDTALSENLLIGAVDADPAAGIQTPAYFFKGAMDEVKIYKTGLNAAEVAELVDTYR